MGAALVPLMLLMPFTLMAQKRTLYEFKKNMPVYCDSLIADMTYPLAWGQSEEKDFDAWRKGLDTVAKDLAKNRAERTLRLTFNEEIWEQLYDFKSEPIPYEKGKKIAVRVVSQFGEESTKVLEM